MTRRLRFAALGAALAYFLDPDNGNRRRKEAIKRLAGLSSRHGRRLARGAASQTHAFKQKAIHRREEPKPQPDDVTLARKVETEIFRDAAVPKGQINVNAEDGVVFLRGEVEQPDLIKDLEEKARSVQGVVGVENLLHTPSEAAPAKPE
jgi:osmotically-inducible protein OsmY